MLRIGFTVFGDPKALKRHRAFRRGDYAGTYDPSKNDKADFIAKAVQNKPDVPIDAPVRLRVDAYFKRPKSHYRTGKFSHQLKDNAPALHTKTPDADNVLKFIMDALNGIFWRDDCLVYYCSIHKKYSTSPRVEIEIKQEG